MESAVRLLADQNALSAQQVAQIAGSVNPDDERHPFIQIADLGLQTNGLTPEPLTLETVTRLTADASDIPYFRIDPLKVDVEAVTALLPQAYTARFDFLPIAVDEREVTIATAEPFSYEWE